MFLDLFFFFFFFNDTATTEIYTLSLHVALPISPDVTAAITYDAANRKTAETVTIGGIGKTYGYSYDGKGNKATFTSPEGITYTYNNNDQPTQITTPAGQITLDYAWVRNTKVTLPNGVVTDFSYNGNSWLSGITAQKQAASVYAANF